MKLKPFLILLIFSFMGIKSYSQIPFKSNTKWKTSQRLDDEFEEITFSPIDTINYNNNYQIYFKPNNKFEAFNIPRCGIDCVIHVFGEFKTTNNKIQFIINKKESFKGCKANGKTILNKNIGTYYLVKDEYSLRLVKSLNDEPTVNYFERNKVKNPKFTDNEAKDLINKYIYLYNRAYKIVENKNKKKYSQIKQEISLWRYKALTYSNKKNTEERNKFRLLTMEWLSNFEVLWNE